jgi:predicted site-specific integrase-resolvase
MANDTIRPEALAESLGVSGKVVRAYLRKTFARAPEAKGSTWVVTSDQAKDVRAHFVARRSAAGS